MIIICLYLGDNLGKTEFIKSESSLKRKFNEIPVEKIRACDEQMCSSKARHFLIRYMPKNSHKYGFVLYVLYGMSDFA